MRKFLTFFLVLFLSLNAHALKIINPLLKKKYCIDYLSASAQSALGACGGIRLMTGNYDSYLMIIKRSSDNVTRSFYYVSDGTLDIYDVRNFIGANTGYVFQLFDQSFNGQFVHQGTTILQPVITASGIGNRPSMTTNQVNTSLSSSSSVIGSTSLFTGNAVFKYSSISNPNVPILTLFYTGDPNYYTNKTSCGIINTNSTTSIDSYRAGQLGFSNTFSSGIALIGTSTYNPLQNQVDVNNIASTPATTTTTALGSTCSTFLFEAPGSNSWFNGTFSEYDIFKINLPQGSADKNQLVRNQSWYYSIPVN